MAKNKSEVAVLTQTTVGVDKLKKPESLDSVQVAGSGDLAGQLGVDLNLPKDVLVARAAEAVNVVDRLQIGAGLCLLKARSECKHGEFGLLLKEADIPPQRAHELMAVASLLESATPNDRARLLKQGKTTLMGLARMDEEVRQKWLETGELDERLTLNEYDALISKKDKLLQQQAEDIKRLSAQVKRDELVGQLALDEVTPLAIAQLRREAASYAQDALACIHGFVGLSEKLEALGAERKTAAWVTPASLSLFSLLQSIQEATSERLTQLIEDFELNRSVPEGAALMMATPGPDEAALIREAMTGVLIDFGRRQANLGHDLYLESRAKAKVKPLGAPRKAPRDGGRG